MDSDNKTLIFESFSFQSLWPIRFLDVGCCTQGLIQDFSDFS